MYDFCPDMKIIVLVKDPLYRTVSEYTRRKHQQIGKGNVYPDFEQFAFHDSDVKDVTMVDKQYKAVHNSLYYLHMQCWIKYFPLNQIHVVDGDNLVDNPHEEVKKNLKVSCNLNIR